MIEIERIEEIKFNTGDTYNLADFNKIYRSFDEIKSVSESLDVMLDLYESLSKYLCMISREVESTGSRRNRSKRILNKYISYFHSNMESLMNVLIMKNDKYMQVIRSIQILLCVRLPAKVSSSSSPCSSTQEAAIGWNMSLNLEAFRYRLYGVPQ